MNNALKCDLCIIGAGSAGLTAAAFAAQMGVSVILIEKNKMGGDCLNRGCIPSKSLIASAKMVRQLKRAPLLGIETPFISINYQQIYQHIQSVIAQIAPHDSIERFEKLGVTVLKGTAKFIDQKTLQVNEQAIQAKYTIIATGGRPFIPPIPGLNQVDYLTHETIFDLQEKPQHLLIIGGGAIGCELAQAYLLLGVPVTLLQRSHILFSNEPELTALAREKLLADGLILYEQAETTLISQKEKHITVQFRTNDHEKHITGSHLLIATGRKPDIDALNLQATQIQYTNQGIQVNNRLQTTQKKIYAIGDVIGQHQFTHIASYHASIALRNILFRIPSHKTDRIIPWVIYTDSELAHVGFSEEDARIKYKKIKVFFSYFDQNDRAQTEHNSAGFIKLITTRKGKILGVSIAGHAAGELINLWSLAIQEKLKVKSLAELIIPYPTRSELNKTVAQSFFAPIIFSKWPKRWVRFLMKRC